MKKIDWTFTFALFSLKFDIATEKTYKKSHILVFWDKLDAIQPLVPIPF